MGSGSEDELADDIPERERTANEQREQRQREGQYCDSLARATHLPGAFSSRARSARR